MTRGHSKVSQGISLSEANPEQKSKAQDYNFSSKPFGNLERTASHIPQSFRRHPHRI
jgi:hypothetical protein